MCEPEMLAMKLKCAFDGCGYLMEIYDVNGSNYWIFIISPAEDLSWRGRVRMAWRYIRYGEKIMHYPREIWLKSETVERLICSLAEMAKEKAKC